MSNTNDLLLPVPGLHLLYDPITGELWRRKLSDETDTRLRPVAARPARRRRAWQSWVYTAPTESGTKPERVCRTLGSIAAAACGAVAPEGAERLRAIRSADAGGRPSIDNFEWVIAGGDPVPMVKTVPQPLRANVERALRREARRRTGTC